MFPPAIDIISTSLAIAPLTESTRIKIEASPRDILSNLVSFSTSASMPWT